MEANIKLVADQKIDTEAKLKEYNELSAKNTNFDKE